MHDLTEVKEAYGVGDLSFFSRPGHVIECEISTTNDSDSFLVTDPVMLKTILFNLKISGGGQLPWRIRCGPCHRQLVVGLLVGARVEGRTGVPALGDDRDVPLTLAHEFEGRPAGSSPTPDHECVHGVHRQVDAGEGQGGRTDGVDHGRFPSRRFRGRR